MYLDLFVLLSGPLLVGAVVGAWISTGRLFLGRLNGPDGEPRWPVWLPSVIGGLVALVGLVILAGQIITLSGGTGSGSVPTHFDEQTAAIIVTLLLSPIWIGSMVMAGLGMVLHYKVDVLLRRLHPVTREGLALGLRAVWAAVGLLVLLFGLQMTYTGIANVYRPTLYGVLIQMDLGAVLLVNVLAILVGLITMYAPAQLEEAQADDEPVTPEESVPEEVPADEQTPADGQTPAGEEL